MKALGKETIGETGVFEKSGSLLGQGATLLVFCFVVLFLEVLAFKMIIDAEIITIGNSMFLRIDREIIVYMVFIIILTAPLFMILGASSVYLGAKSKSARYAQGERRSFYVVRGAPGYTSDMMAEINVERSCPKCNAGLGSIQSKYCPECGENLDSSVNVNSGSNSSFE